MKSARERWFAVAAVMLATSSMVLATTIINVSIPAIMAEFRMGQDQAQWLSTGFIGAMAATMLLTSWCVRAFGIRATYLATMAVFFAASIAGGTAGGPNAVTLARIVQGAAGGVVQPLAMIVIFQVFPYDQRGRAMGLYGLAVVLSPAIGPAAGGLMTLAFGWRSVFFAVLPFCLVGVLMAAKYLPGREERGERPAFDAPGFALLSGFILALFASLRSGRSAGWLSGATLLLIVASLAAGAGFVVREVRCRKPLLDLRIFSNRQFAAAAAVSFVYGVGIYGSTYLIPLLVQTVSGYDPMRSGLLLLPGGLVLAVAIFIAGHLTDRYPAWLIVSSGLAGIGVSFALFGRVDAATSFAALAWWIVLGRIGLGLVIPALNAGAVQTLSPELLNQGSGAINFVRLLGGAFGVTLLSAVLDWRIAYHAASREGARVAGFRDAFLMAALIFGLALLPAFFMRRGGNHHGPEDPAGV
ncbi:MAG TPA: DHA2 family efflux MFS transporter permease subunit [Candidatus Deferrimicrobiaceae bacterium]|jgi:EmrB/QacA subfamily drug resistance transporter